MPTGEIAVLGRQGDTKLMWDSAKGTEVDAARAMFDRLRGQGYLAFAVSKAGEKGEQINAFDPNAEKIIMAAPLRGGR